MEAKQKNSFNLSNLTGLWLLWLIPIAIFGLWIASFSSTDQWQTWFSAEGDKVWLWWALTSLAGLGVFPLLYRLLPGLADRGYSLARTAGLMLVGFVFWLLASLGLLQNSPNAIVLAWLIVLSVSLFAWLKWPQRPTLAELKNWFQDQLPLIIITEFLFLVAFFAWAYFKAHNPELTSTEKPMEMAFINGIRNSATFPPKDPWLSGYAISYYYFGYIIAASLADLSRIPTGMAFNLTDALLFALTVTGAFGIAYNLVRSINPLQQWRVGGRSAAIGTGLLAAALLALSGNLGTALIEMPYRGYAADIPVVKSIVDANYFDFWDNEYRSGPFYIEEFVDGANVIRLLDTNQTLPAGSSIPADYVRAPDTDNDGIPDWDDTDNTSHLANCQDDDPANDTAACQNTGALPIVETGGWWWWPYSRVIRDRDLGGTQVGAQPIAEMPQFSFILSDNHPHVFSLPMTLLIMGLAISLVIRSTPLQAWEILLYGVLIGALIFANAWDAVYLLIIIAAEALRRLLRNGTGRLTGGQKLSRIFSFQENREQFILLITPVFIVLLIIFVWRDIPALNTYTLLAFFAHAILAAVASIPATLLLIWLLDDNDWAGTLRLGILLFITFYAFYYAWISSFSSQANGFFPNVVFPTRSQQFFLQFGIFGVLILPFIFQQIYHAATRLNWVTIGLIVFIGLFILVSLSVFSAVFVNWQCPVGGEKWGQVERFSEWACEARSSLLGGYDSQDSMTLAADVVRRRMGAMGSELVVLFIIAVVISRLFPRQLSNYGDSDPSPLNLSPNTALVLLLIAAGAVAALIPDFIYLRDNFSQRINTVFKLYYQAWALFSIGAAYAAYSVLSGSPRRYTEDAPISPLKPSLLSARVAYAGIGGLFVIAGLLFPYYGIEHRALYNSNRVAVRTCPERLGTQNCAEEEPLSLDGSDTYINSGNGSIISADEYRVMQCLAELVPYKSDAVLVEAWGGAYTPQLGRFSMFTGIPTLLGWDNHEHQWRGVPEYYEKFGASERQSDIDLLYRLPADQWSQAEQIITEYGIDYIVVGGAERHKYRSSTGDPINELNKFAQLLDPICSSGNIAVYRTSGQ